MLLISSSSTCTHSVKQKFCSSGFSVPHIPVILSTETWTCLAAGSCLRSLVTACRVFTSPAVLLPRNLNFGHAPYGNQSGHRGQKHAQVKGLGIGRAWFVHGAVVCGRRRPVVSALTWPGNTGCHDFRTCFSRMPLCTRCRATAYRFSVFTCWKHAAFTVVRFSCSSLNLPRYVVSNGATLSTVVW